MRFVELLTTLILMLTFVEVKGQDAEVKGRDLYSRRRHRYNPYAVPPPGTVETIDDDYDEVEVSSYCRESVAHHENYVRAITQAPNSTSKVCHDDLHSPVEKKLRAKKRILSLVI